MIQLMIAAPRSGSGKTVVTCALLRALQKRGLTPCAFKCGPDYIDPTFHRSVLGVESRNLDLFLSSESCVRALYERGCGDSDAAVVEGVMGYYDGLGGTSDRSSSWHVAETLELPVLLVLRAKGASLTLAAEIRGLLAFRENSRVAGALLNECSSGLYETLAPVLERETGVPVLGCLPEIEAAKIDSRRLGLYTAGEVERLRERVDAVAQALSENMDWQRFSEAFDRKRAKKPVASVEQNGGQIRVAVASDKAFSFTYYESLETLRKYGAEPVPFSPLNDAELPDKIGGIYLPGGYPELHAKALFDNESMRKSIKCALENGVPTVAECGGFLYLGATLCDERGKAYPMVGVLPGRASDTGRLVRFGYQTLRADADSLLFRAGEAFPAHEFHYWESDDCGDALRVEKGARGWRCGFVGDTLYAAFPHLYFAGRPELAERFVAAARKYGETHGFA